MTSHRLDALLKPRSVAIVGASDKPGSNGHAMASMCPLDGYAGAIYLVNPRLTELGGTPCYPDLSSLPETPEHVVIGVASRFVEAILDQAIALGVKSASIFASCYLDDDAQPALPQRITAKAYAAGMAICGANCMGFYTPGQGLRIASMSSAPGLRQGGIAWIAQSGSTFGALSHNDRRLGFTLCVSTGMELVTTVADYMDWALCQPETRVIGLFLESVRNPAAFVKALEKARASRIPVVVLKVGRTEKSAQMAVSHTGAIAGNDAAYEAVFRKYGVTRVSDMDEMAATLALFDTPRAVPEGQLGVVSDSGGEREMIVDLADDIGVPFAALDPSTCTALAQHLEPGLHPENPLDAFGTQSDLVNRFAHLTASLANDPNVALGFFMSDPRDGYGYAEDYTRAVIDATAMTDKPLALVTNYSMTDERELAQKLKAAGVPLLRGTQNALRAARHVMAYRDFVGQPEQTSGALPSVGKWRQALGTGARLSEHDGLAMLAEFGISSPRLAHVSDATDLPAALDQLRFPLVLKSAENIAHKSDVGGVALNISDMEGASAAYAEMAARLGSRALFMEMAPKGTELALGAIWDDNFGPVVLISAGGVLIELLEDRIAALAPFDETEAMRLLTSLRVYQILQGVRGQPAADLVDLAGQVACFSRLVAALGDSCAEIDINPMICGENGAVAVDCLAVGRTN
ncbi:acetate--CoA ligase family protein [Pseudohalocynthiibacter aestuariivivens]|nr:acetate--CoA ligase family protein [Pseudohalocynthiibacter aestuariivivens]QIE46294.1 acetate--CoA ligase family protein [Pseudohalocynthiibacter aestuariivivens]